MKFIYKPGATKHADGLFRQPNHMAGLQENLDVLTFLETMFNLNIKEQQTTITAMTLGWSRVTREDILCSWGQEVENPMELDFQAIMTQENNRNTLARWQIAHRLEEQSNCL